jgi:hypothetical protein
MNTPKLTLAQAQALVTTAAVNRSKAHNFAYSLHRYDPREAQAWADLKAAEEQVEIAGQALAEALKQPNANGQDEVSSPSHTPGPWNIQFSSGNNGQGGYVHRLQSGITIIQHLNGTTEKEIHANARLIAAAPELLDILKDCAGVLQSFEDQLKGKSFAVTDVLAKSRAAIAKATQA